MITSINNKKKTNRKYWRAKNQTRRDKLHNLLSCTTDEKEIEQKIKAMKDNKAVGPNSTRTKILNFNLKH